jgi:hypothetical protein
MGFAPVDGNKPFLIPNKEYRMNRMTRNLTASATLFAAAMSGMMAGCSNHSGTDSGAAAVANAPDKHGCKGQNSCKGNGGCKTGNNGCKGLNSCKGQGGCKTM